MIDFLRLLACALMGLLRSRARLEAEILVLRHQLNVLSRKALKRVAFNSIDRLVLTGLYRLAPGVLDALKILKPEMVIRWHRAGFRPIGAGNRERAVMADRRHLSLPEIKSGRIDGVGLRDAERPRCGQPPELHATLVHPCSAIGACLRHCNIVGTTPAVGGGAARRTPRHDQGTPVGSRR